MPTLAEASRQVEHPERGKLFPLLSESGHIVDFGIEKGDTQPVASLSPVTPPSYDSLYSESRATYAVDLVTDVQMILDEIIPSSMTGQYFRRRWPLQKEFVATGW
jgi:hypothetical protein